MTYFVNILGTLLGYQQSEKPQCSQDQATVHIRQSCGCYTEVYPMFTYHANSILHMKILEPQSYSKKLVDMF